MTMDSREPSVGGAVLNEPAWAVVKGDYPQYSAVGPISKRTPQRIYHPSKWGGSREEFSDLRVVVFEGREDACKLLADRLLSSQSLSEQERKTAYERHIERTRKLILSAQDTSDGQASPGRDK